MLAENNFGLDGQTIATIRRKLMQRVEFKDSNCDLLGTASEVDALIDIRLIQEKLLTPPRRISTEDSSMSSREFLDAEGSQSAEDIDFVSTEDQPMSEILTTTNVDVDPLASQNLIGESSKQNLIGTILQDKLVPKMHRLRNFFSNSNSNISSENETVVEIPSMTRNQSCKIIYETEKNSGSSISSNPGTLMEDEFEVADSEEEEEMTPNILFTPPVDKVQNKSNMKTIEIGTERISIEDELTEDFQPGRIQFASTQDFTQDSLLNPEKVVVMKNYTSPFKKDQILAKMAEADSSQERFTTSANRRSAQISMENEILVVIDDGKSEAHSKSPSAKNIEKTVENRPSKLKDCDLETLQQLIWKDKECDQFPNVHNFFINE